MPYNPYTGTDDDLNAYGGVNGTYGPPNPAQDPLSLLAQIQQIRQQSDALMGHPYDYPTTPVMQQIPAPPVRDFQGDTHGQQKGALLAALFGLMSGQGLAGVGAALGGAQQGIQGVQDRRAQSAQERYQAQAAAIQNHNAIVRQQFADQLSDIDRKRNRDIQQASVLDRQAAHLGDDLNDLRTADYRNQVLAGQAAERQARKAEADREFGLKQEQFEFEKGKPAAAAKQKEREALEQGWRTIAATGNDANLSEVNAIRKRLGYGPLKTIKKPVAAMTEAQRLEAADRKRRTDAYIGQIDRQAKIDEKRLAEIDAHIGQMNRSGQGAKANPLTTANNAFRAGLSDVALAAKEIDRIRAVHKNDEDYDFDSDPDFITARGRLKKAYDRKERLKQNVDKLMNTSAPISTKTTTGSRNATASSDSSEFRRETSGLTPQQQAIRDKIYQHLHKSQ